MKRIAATLTALVLIAIAAALLFDRDSQRQSHVTDSAPSPPPHRDLPNQNLPSRIQPSRIQPSRDKPNHDQPSRNKPGRDDPNQTRRDSDTIPYSWIPQPTDVDLDALEARLIEGEARQQFELAMREDRRLAIDHAQQAFQRCSHHESLPPQARFAIEFTLKTHAGEGLISHPFILLKPSNLDAPLLFSCLLDALTDARFDATGDGAELQVQWIYP